MKNWIKKKLGIESHAKDQARISEEVAQAFLEGFENGMNKVDKLEHKWPCPFCDGTGSTSYGPGLHENHMCGVCKGTGREYRESDAIDILKDVLKDVDKTDSVHDVQGVKNERNHTIIDPLLHEFESIVWGQQEKVLRSGKYENPIHRSNHTAMEWMDHQMSEFADALVYRECLKQTIEEVIQAIQMAERLNRAQSPSNTRDRVSHYLCSALERLGKG